MTTAVKAGPSKVPTPPSTPQRPGRRSWFSFGSSTASTSSPTKKDESGSRRARAVEEEVELAALGPASPATPSSLIDEDEEEESLTIDGDPETTIRKKRSRSSRDASEGESLRMDDLAGKSGVRKTSGGSMRRMAPDPGGTAASASASTLDIRLLY